MLPDPARIEATRAWLIRARRDLRSAEHGLAAEPPLLDDVVFHCQQAAEKALKAFLAWHDEPFRRTHSLEEIGRQCVALDAALQPVVDRAVPLTEYAWRFRYPADIEEPTLAETREALGIAHEVHSAILARLPVEALP